MYQDFEEPWNHRHYFIFNQEQCEEIRRINFECFENLNTAIIRSMPQFIQTRYTDEIIFDDTEPDYQHFQRIKGPIWIDYPSRETIQVKFIYSLSVCHVFLQYEFDAIKFAFENRQCRILENLHQISDDDMSGLDILRKYHILCHIYYMRYLMKFSRSVESNSHWTIQRGRSCLRNWNRIPR